MNVDDFFLVQFILNSLPSQYGSFQINYNAMKDNGMSINWPVCLIKMSQGLSNLNNIQSIP